MRGDRRRLRDRLDRALGFLAFGRGRLRAGRRFCAACAFVLCNLARRRSAALGRIFLAIDRRDMRRVSIEIWPADRKLRLVPIDPFPPFFACGESLQTGLALDAPEIYGKPVAIAAAAPPGVK